MATRRERKTAKRQRREAAAASKRGSSQPLPTARPTTKVEHGELARARSERVDHHVDVITAKMLAGTWVQGQSLREYAEEVGAAVNTARYWAAHAARRIVDLSSRESRQEAAGVATAKLQRIADDAHQAGEFRAAVGALDVVCKIAGVYTHRIEVQEIAADAPPGIRDLMAQAVRADLPEEQRDKAARQVQAAILLHLLAEVDDMEEPMRSELRCAVVDHVDRWRA